jgi:hypothetical protein
VQQLTAVPPDDIIAELIRTRKEGVYVAMEKAIEHKVGW